MSKKELNNLRQRISEIALHIKEQEAFTVQIQDFFRKKHPKKVAFQQKIWAQHHAR